MPTRNRRPHLHIEVDEDTIATFNARARRAGLKQRDYLVALLELHFKVYGSARDLLTSTALEPQDAP